MSGGCPKRRIVVAGNETDRSCWFLKPPPAPVHVVTMEGNPGLSRVRDEEQALRIDHGIEIVPDQCWANTEGAGGIVSADGGTLVAGSGLVEPGS